MSSSTALDIDAIALVCSKSRLENSLALLQAVNSNFPATREFLRLKGLESVAQLDRNGMIELQEFLRRVYKRLIH